MMGFWLTNLEEAKDNEKVVNIEDITEKQKLEESYVELFNRCKDVKEFKAEYKKAFKLLDDNGSYATLPVLWKAAKKVAVHRGWSM